MSTTATAQSELLPKLDPAATHWAKTSDHRNGSAGQLVTTTLCGIGDMPVVQGSASGTGGRQMCARCVYLYNAATQEAAR